MKYCLKPLSSDLQTRPDILRGTFLFIFSGLTIFRFVFDAFKGKLKVFNIISLTLCLKMSTTCPHILAKNGQVVVAVFRAATSILLFTKEHKAVKKAVKFIVDFVSMKDKNGELVDQVLSQCGDDLIRGPL